MRQRFVRIESRNAGVFVTVSDRAFSVRVPMLMSLAHDGISPQRIVVKCRDFFRFPCGRSGLAALAQCCIADALQPHHPRPENAQQDTASNASVGICYTPVHCRRFPALRYTQGVDDLKLSPARSE